MSAEVSACTQWCSDGDCEPSEGFHVSAGLIAARGGPMKDPDSDRTVDIVPSVSIRRPDYDTASVIVEINTWLRLSRQGSWGIPGELLHLLTPVDMSPTRARCMAELLVEAADECDRLNDHTAAPEQAL